MNINCIICSDLISQSENIYFTRCGHVFHYHCLAQWIERSKSCPQCRNKVTESCISRVYFNFASGEGITEDATSLQSKLDNASLQLRLKSSELKEKQDKIKALEEQLKVNAEILKGTEKKLTSKETAILALKDQLEYVKVQNRETERLRAENETLSTTLSRLKDLEKVLHETADEVEQMLEAYTDVKMLATFATALKRALNEAERQKKESRAKLQNLKTELASKENTVIELENVTRKLKENLLSAQRKVKSLHAKRKLDEASSSFTERDEAPAKIHKPNDSSDIYIASTSTDSPPILIANDSLNNLSMNSHVKRIELADSPYLRLQQGGGVGAGLTAMRVRNALPVSTLKPSEFSIFSRSNSAHCLGRSQPTSSKSSTQENNHSIFNSKVMNRSVDMFLDDMVIENGRLDISYDGLGGHSKPDTFPVPLKKSPMKSCVPKVTARHRLKNPSKTTKIGDFFDKIKTNR